jgi:hypothetical protein
MVSALVFCAIAGWTSLSQPLSLTPKDDVWTYPNASDASKDPYLRAWGSQGKSVPSSAEESSSFSASFLQWDVSSVPTDKKVKAARLVLTHIASPTFTQADVNKSPLEARLAGTGFDQTTWDPTQAATYMPEPGERSLLGSAIPDLSKPIDKPFTITIDLLKGPGDFRDALTRAIKSDKKLLGLAITSSIDPEQLGMRSIYKVYSRDSEPATVPKLELDFE